MAVLFDEQPVAALMTIRKRIGEEDTAADAAAATGRA
jgi:hypothetical protein